ncbi:MAG: CoA protein activase [Bacillota bacterium]
MKVTFAHMGNLWITVKTILEDLGVEVVVPPRPSRRSLEVGVRHSPEFACFPLKMNIGDYIGAIERGADTIVMVGGVGPCRLGHYAQVQAEILRDLGYRAEMVILEPPRGHFSALLDKIRYLTGGKPISRVVRALRFGWEKLYALDCLDRALVRTRPLEVVPGGAAAAHRRAVAAVAGAAGVEATRRARDEGVTAVLAAGGAGAAWEDDGEAGGGLPGRNGTPLRVGIVGEIFMVAEPFANQDLERRLGEMGVEVTRALYVSDWVRINLLLDTLRLRRCSRQSVVKEAASPYLGHFVGGEGLESVGETVLYSRQGYDGVIHVAPFTCMPEIVATSLLPEVGRDLDLPVMSLFLDEHSGEAGLATRLEAFVDLLARRRARAGAGRATR